MVDIDKEAIAYEVAMDDFFKTNYAMLLATFLEGNHDKFMEHCEEQYEDHEGLEMKWIWKPTNREVKEKQ